MTAATAATAATLALPDLEPHQQLTLPPQRETIIANGLTVIAIQRRSVPLVELRLLVPFARSPLACAALLTQTLFCGTSARTAVEIAAQWQSVGGALGAGLDHDHLQVGGNALASGLDQLLASLAEVLRDAAYPAQEVATQRDRLIDQISVSLSKPSRRAWIALVRRMYGTHPYAMQVPDIEKVNAVDPADLRALHAQRLRPDGATLVLVGDIDLDEAFALARKHLGSWEGTGRRIDLPPVPALEPGPALLVDQPGAQQSSLRIALPAVNRMHPDHEALQLANMIFGGYFSSRWVENIRENKGYTYDASSAVEHSLAGSRLVMSAEVATEVTAPTLVETLYELGRAASLPPTETELERARQYDLGSLGVEISTQEGLAGLASTFAGAGLRLDYLADSARRMEAVTAADVQRVAREYLAPAKAVIVVLGDACRIADEIAAIVAVEQMAPDSR